MKNVLSAAILLMLGTTACGPELDRLSEVNTLRVLAVQKSSPYAKPGEMLELNMLWHNGAEEKRPVERLWLTGCLNPPADLYANCFEVFAKLSPDEFLANYHPITPPESDPPASSSTSQDTFQFTLPAADQVFARPPPVDPRLPRYGLSYVFFAVCAGTLEPAVASDSTFPILCKDDADNALGAADFVVGYTAIYIYENYTNNNPIVTGFEVAGKAVTIDRAAGQAGACIGKDCFEPVPAPPAPPVDEDCTLVPCVDACAADGEDSCPEIPIRPVVDRASAEADEISSVAQERTLEEQLWVNYHVERGSVKSDVRLLNEATKGWNEDHGTKLFAPKQTGLMHIWAIVRDNRGGSDWVRVPILVR